MPSVSRLGCFLEATNLEADGRRRWVLAAEYVAALLLCPLGDRRGPALDVSVGFITFFFSFFFNSVLGLAVDQGAAVGILHFVHFLFSVARCEEGAGSHWAAQPPGRQETTNRPLFIFFSLWAVGHRTTARLGFLRLGVVGQWSVVAFTSCSTSSSSVVAPSSSEIQMGASGLPSRPLGVVVEVVW